MINEKSFLKNINGGEVSAYADIIEEKEIRGEEDVYSFDGQTRGPVVVSRSHACSCGILSSSAAGCFILWD